MTRFLTIIRAYRAEFGTRALAGEVLFVPAVVIVWLLAAGVIR